MKTNLKLLGLSSLTALFLSLPNPAKADSTALQKFGVCDHIRLSSTDAIAACDEIIQAGIKNVRLDISWDLIERPAKGQYNATELALEDSIIKRLNDAGVTIDLVLLDTARWAAAGGDVLKGPINQQDWRDYLTFICTRWNNQITYYEIWNEEDYSTNFWHGTVQDYVNLLQTAYSAIRAVNANNKIVLGGVSGVAPYTDSFFNGILAAGAGSYFDIVNYHSYDVPAIWRTAYSTMKARINQYGLQSRKIWITETGYSTSGTAALESMKSQYMENIYYSQFALDPNMEKVFVYVNRNTATGNAREDNFGFLTHTARTPLPAFYHFQAVGGAETDYKLQTAYASTQSRRTLNYIVDGAVTNYAVDGSSKRLHAGGHMYHTINDEWMYNNCSDDEPIYVDVTFLDSGTGTWFLDYDGLTSGTQTLTSTLANTGAWVKKTFTLNDAKFANRMTAGSDFRLGAPTSVDLIVSSVKVRRDDTKGWAALGVTGTSDKSWQMWRFNVDLSGTNGGSGYNPIVTMGGKQCRKIIDSSKFIYFNVSESLVPPTRTNLTITTTFWDAGLDLIMLQYNAIGNAYKALYITKTNTGTWRTVSSVISDAQFLDSQGLSSFRYGSAGDNNNAPEYISDVKIQ